MNRKQFKHLATRGFLTLLLTNAVFLNHLHARNKGRSEKDKKGGAHLVPRKLKVGEMAPDFTLLAFDGKDLKKVSLQDYRGKKNVA
jgi:hypothetical protein